MISLYGKLLLFQETAVYQGIIIGWESATTSTIRITIMKNIFGVKPTPHLLFGCNEIMKLPQLITRFGKKALLVVGSRSFTASEEWLTLQQLLDDRGITWGIYRVKGEPSPEMVDTVCWQYRKSGIAVVAAIGGGSVLDCGKAIAAMLASRGSVGDYLEGVGHLQPDGFSLPFIAAPTTSGTGSEMTSNAVLSKVGADGYKKSLRHDGYIPDIAVVDPLLAMNCPPQVSGYCGMDTFSQLVESYLSTRGSAYTDDLALGGIGRIRPSLPVVAGGSATVEDRTNMAYGATISGITLTNAGLGIVHGFASVIGGAFPIPHGVICGTLMAAANKVTLEECRRQKDSRALHKYTMLGKIFTHGEKRSDEYLQDSFIAHLYSLSAELKLFSLAAYDIAPEALRTIAQKSGAKNNPVPLHEEQRLKILRLSMTE